MEPITPSVLSLAPISVRGTVGAALQFIRAEWKPLLRIALILSLVSGILETLAMALSANPQNSPGSFNPQVIVNSLESLLLFMAQGITASWQFVATMRFVALGEQPTAWFPTFPPTLWRYFWRAFLLGLIFIFVLLPFGLLGVIGTAVGLIINFHQFSGFLLLLIAILVGIVIMQRFMLAPVAAAVGEDSRFIVAWRRTKGQVLRIMGVIFLTGLVTMLIALASGLLTLFVGLLSKTLAGIIGATITNLAVGMLSGTVNVLMLRYFYQTLPDKPQEAEGDHVL